MNLENERKKIEIKRVTMARDEMVFKILQRQADIDRLNDQVLIQDDKIKELKSLIKKEV